MGPQYREVGGGRATGFADEFVTWLQGALQTGSFGGATAGQRTNGANPVGQTMGISSILNDILSGGAGQLGGSMNEMIQRDTERGANNIRARFGTGGGSSFGTGAGHAEALYRAEAAPRATQAIGQLQMGAINQLLPLFAQVFSRGTTQREGLVQPNPWASAASIAAPIIGGGIGLMTGGPAGAAAGASIGSSINWGSSGRWDAPQTFTSPVTTQAAIPWWGVGTNVSGGPN